MLTKRLTPRALLFIAIVVGVIVRTFHLFVIDNSTPFRLGGLYYAFAEQILSHGFRLPQTIPYYTQAGIPFAYPPLPFYIEAVLLPFLPRFLLVNVLPPVLASLSVLVFARMAWRHFSGRWAAVAAVAVFGLMTQAWLQQTEGGGLAEAMGTLALAGLTYYLLKEDERRADALKMGAFIGIAFLSAPGTTLAAGLAAALYVLKHLLAVRRGRMFYELTQPLIAAVMAAVLIALFVVPVINYHGLDVFLTPLNSQVDSREKAILPDLLKLENFQTSRSALWIILFGVGLLWALARRRLLLLVWALGLMAVPREGVWMMAVPATLLIGGGIVELIAPTFNALAEQHYAPYARPVIALAVILCLWLAGNDVYATALDRLDERDFILYDAQLEALNWVRANLPTDANLIVLGNKAMTEWSPQIAQRTVLNTPYGAEWQPKEEDVTSDFDGDIWNCDQDTDCYIQSISKYYPHGHNVYLISDSKHGKDGRDHKMADYDEASVFTEVYDQDDIVIVHYTP